MNQKTTRVGNFTSSEIAALMVPGTRTMTEKEQEQYKIDNPKGRRTTIDVMFGKGALTYIQTKNRERRLGRSIKTETNSRPTSWGNLVELQAFNVLGLEYKISSTETIGHPTIPHWKGSPDCEKFDEGKTVVDIKCPMTLNSFCELADCNTPDELRENHTDGEKYYWQLVSNAVLTGAKYAELIAYVPYQKELAAIRELANNWEGNPNKIAWVNWAEDADLPYLLEGRHYKNVHILRWEVSEEARAAITNAVTEAGKLLEQAKTPAEPKYAPTDDQKLSAQEKIRLIKQLADRLKIHVS